MECIAVPGESLQTTLDTCKPTCWNCEVAEEFRRRNPELVVERPAFPLHAGHNH